MRTHEMSAALQAQQVRVMDGGPQPSGAAASSAGRPTRGVRDPRDVAAAGAKGVNGGDGDEDVVLLRWFELPRRCSIATAAHGTCYGLGVRRA